MTNCPYTERQIKQKKQIKDKTEKKINRLTDKRGSKETANTGYKNIKFFHMFCANLHFRTGG